MVKRFFSNILQHAFREQVDVIETWRRQGKNKMLWTPENHPAGIYYFRLEPGEKVATGKGGIGEIVPLANQNF